MTKITISNRGGQRRILAKGHATGSLKVCAGISGILYALAGWLKNYESGAAIRLDPADADISAPETGPEVKAAFEVATIGLLQIALQYPDYLAVTLCSDPSPGD